jgi:hypothetical protein
MLSAQLESLMRIVTLVAALALANAATAQDVKPPPKIDAGVQSAGPKAKATPSVSAEEEQKAGAAMDEKRKAAEEAKQRAWDANMKRTMSGICRGC